jgi:hypothetical protein
MKDVVFNNEMFLNSNAFETYATVLLDKITDHLFGLVVRVPGYRSRGPGSISGATGFSEK